MKEIKGSNYASEIHTLELSSTEVSIKPVDTSLEQANRIYKRLCEENFGNEDKSNSSNLELKQEDKRVNAPEGMSLQRADSVFDSIIEADIKKANATSELSKGDKERIKEETGWSEDIIDYIADMEQYEIYKNADLHEEVINGRRCLVKDIDLNCIDPKTEKTNRELMNEGKSPIDPKTGEKIELHHMGQEYASPFAELCENSEHGDGKHSILHTKYEDSWRNNSELHNQYNNSDRPNHWKERAKE